ncbi:unnamed protein product [Acanthoscelides obtectus]|uniref:Uncharacterized protein n=1 Tax=Acanthoscelides obtectus TaxID=200917 RepID=A0A9P0KDS6_ACAOB|nr:unnamed protein product [Acanthoscelides obtectus]CAK1632304.1 hypothetical protein AOBTE_LOCUS7470 [Acanthoscelides obtectus]
MLCDTVSVVGETNMKTEATSENRAIQLVDANRVCDSQHRRANMAGFTLQLLVFFGLVCLSYQQSSHARYALQASDDYVDLDDIETIRANGSSPNES